MSFLRVIYVLAIAALLIALVIMGVEAFNPAPQYPEYPDDFPEPTPAYNTTEYEEWRQELKKRQEEWKQLVEEYRRKAAARDRNTFFIVLPLGVVFAIVGIFIRRRLDIFGAGLILGGIGTIIFTTVPYHLDNKLRFVGIAVALAVLIFAGYKIFLSLRKT